MLHYRRDVLVDTLVYHWRTNTSGCGCGWAELGRSHPEHVADVYEAALSARQEGPEHLRSVIRKIVNDDTGVLNDEGYLVVDDNSDPDFGSRVIDLTSEEFAAVKAALAARTEADRG